MGQCSECGDWNTLVEEVQEQTTGKKHSQAVQSIAYPEVELTESSFRRFSTGIDELDRVLGNDDASTGMVLGSVVLVGGEPGIGKSTLLTQVLLEQIKKPNSGKGPVVYVAGEESPSQIRLRMKRLAGNDITLNSLDQKAVVFVTGRSVEAILKECTKLSPRLVIVDSVQTLVSETLSGSAGSVGQVRMTADLCTSWAKQQHVPLFLVGHVTKEGSIAGPKVLEHIVDTVLEISGERTSELRLLRSVKNRFGATDEVGVFSMTEHGLTGVSDPSDVLVQTETRGTAGSSIVCLLEGTRPLLVEIQALVVKSQLAMPRRVGRGVELSRIQILSAVLEKHCKIPVSQFDIFVSISGGFKISEPALDLGIALAIASSWANVPLPEDAVSFGEVGLLGELRKVPYSDKREKEAKRLGFKTVISHSKTKRLSDALTKLNIKKK